MSVRAKKFRPPLKASAETRTSWLSPSLSSAPNSQASGGDSLPATQTHTVLSYCENYQDEEHSESFEDHSPTSSVSQESEAEIEVASRFKRHKPYPLPKTYGYRTEQHKKKTVADLERSLGKGRVRISLPVAGVGQKPCGSNLSVYDCQPTPPESVGVVSRDITLSLKSKEEQLAIDREVIALIKKTRLELKKIREKYVKRCNLPFQSVGVVNNKPLPLVFTSRLVNED